LSGKINWDAHNRQEKLWRWYRDHGNYEWLEKLPRPTETEIDRWAKRQVRISASNVRKAIEEKVRKENSPEIKISTKLETIETALEDEDFPTAKNAGEEVFNYVLSQQLIFIDNTLREQIAQTISLLFVLCEDHSQESDQPDTNPDPMLQS
jgi:hypothetical protein